MRVSGLTHVMFVIAILQYIQSDGVRSSSTTLCNMVAPPWRGRGRNAPMQSAIPVACPTIPSIRAPERRTRDGLRHMGIRLAGGRAGGRPTSARCRRYAVTVTVP